MDIYYEAMFLERFNKMKVYIGLRKSFDVQISFSLNHGTFWKPVKKFSSLFILPSSYPSSADTADIWGGTDKENASQTKDGESV